jgi:hypothetical protein
MRPCDRQFPTVISVVGSSPHAGRGPSVRHAKSRDTARQSRTQLYTIPRAQTNTVRPAAGTERSQVHPGPQERSPAVTSAHGHAHGSPRGAAARSSHLPESSPESPHRLHCHKCHRRGEESTAIGVPMCPSPQSPHPNLFPNCPVLVSRLPTASLTRARAPSPCARNPSAFFGVGRGQRAS